jgi:hypothetical protein
MFDFMNDFDNYNDRMVARDEFDWGIVSTVAVSDGEHPFETAVAHDEYNGGHLVIVGAYPSRADAEVGHAKWIATMTAPELPPRLVDVCNAGIGKLCAAAEGSPDGTLVFDREVVSRH